MGVHGLLVVGGEQRGRLAVAEIRVRRLVRPGELPYVRPGRDTDIRRRRRLAGIGTPVPPGIDRGAVALGSEPALVTHGDLTDHVPGGTGRRRGGGGGLGDSQRSERDGSGTSDGGA